MTPWAFAVNVQMYQAILPTLVSVELWTGPPTLLADITVMDRIPTQQCVDTFSTSPASLQR